MSAANTIAARTDERDQTIARKWPFIASVLLLAVVAFISPQIVPGWASMFINCAATIFALKQGVWHTSENVTRAAAPGDRAKFYFLWIGFDLPAFLDRAAERPTTSAWFTAVARIAASAAVLWGVNRWLPYDRWPLECGIVGIGTGIIFFHFGLFYFLALVWQAAGRNVQPINDAPWAAESLADFWGRRWNLAFRDSAALIIFRPIARRWGVRAATFATFFASGILHEVVISLPARGGYGLPTLYFLLQCAAMMLQRGFVPVEPNRWNLISRIITMLVVFAPMPLLFTKPFCEHVAIPFLHALGAL